MFAAVLASIFMQILDDAIAIGRACVDISLPPATCGALCCAAVPLDPLNVILLGHHSPPPACRGYLAANGSVFLSVDRNLNPKSACLKRRDEQKSDVSGPMSSSNTDITSELTVINLATKSSFDCLSTYSVLSCYSQWTNVYQGATWYAHTRQPVDHRLWCTVIIWPP